MGVTYEYLFEASFLLVDSVPSETLTQYRNLALDIRSMVKGPGTSASLLISMAGTS